jgi:hypothetical protein
VNIEQLAYLKTPDKIRAALINTTGSAPSLYAIERRLSTMPKREVKRIDEPKDSDALGFTKRKPVVPKRKPPIVTPEERERIARIAATIPDKPVPVVERPTVGAGYGRKLVQYVMQELNISHDEFFGRRRKRRAVAAASLIVSVLRAADKYRYSLPAIAKLVGRKDHSTMIYALEQWPVYAKMFPDVAALHDDIIARLQVGAESCK